MDGVSSSWRKVWSGVPQGSVLAPILFLVYINDLNDQLSINVLKFADDTKLFRVVDNHINGQTLQKDIDLLGEWAVQWQMLELYKMIKGFSAVSWSQFFTRSDMPVLPVVTTGSYRKGITNQTFGFISFLNAVLIAGTASVKMLSKHRM